MKRKGKIVSWSLIILCVLYFLLLIPDSTNMGSVVIAGGKAFTWNRDAQWLQMEKLFQTI